jgi:nifR3 family TIM-barrel protein
LLDIIESEHPVGIQLFGDDLNSLVYSVKYLNENSTCDFIDFNMGCPAPKIAVKSNSGSSLLKDPTRIKELLTAMVKNSKKPITAKIRIGWDRNSINAVEVAKIIQETGVSAIFVHGRTRSDAFKNEVNLEVIKNVVDAVNIPVFGNGDITDIASFNQMLRKTNCAGVLIGRATVGNPWIFNELKSSLDKSKFNYPNVIDITNMLKQQITQSVDRYGEKLALLNSRSYAPKYLKKVPFFKIIRDQLMKSTTLVDFLELIDRLVAENHLKP